MQFLWQKLHNFASNGRPCHEGPPWAERPVSAQDEGVHGEGAIARPKQASQGDVYSLGARPF